MRVTTYTCDHCKKNVEWGQLFWLDGKASCVETQMATKRVEHNVYAEWCIDCLVNEGLVKVKP